MKEELIMNGEKEIITQAVNELAPCGLDCARCVSFKGGLVEQLSSQLLAALEGYEHIAKNAANFYPILAHYQTFIDVLSHFKTHATCTGCRFTESGGCGVRKCHKENHVNFCFECSSYLSIDSFQLDSFSLYLSVCDKPL